MKLEKLILNLFSIASGSQPVELKDDDEIETIELRDTVVMSVHENGPIEIHVTDENGLEYNLDDISYVKCNKLVLYS